MTDQPTSEWLAALAGGEAALVRRSTPSGAELALAGDVVVKLHHPRTDAAALTARLDAIGHTTLAPLWVQPLDRRPRQAPDGRWATVWPRVEVLAEDAADHPWAEAGRLLGRLHRTPVDPSVLETLPQQGGPARVARALDRARALDHPVGKMLVELGARLVDEATLHLARHQRIVHGDWHLGQLARTAGGLLLLDADDLGVGDPAWDLARPAGFWAAGLLADEPWEAFLGAYREAGGTAVPTTGDPWPRLDVPARCAVLVAAVRALRVQPAHSADPADALFEACARM